jgi:cation:H+ antiporter
VKGEALETISRLDGAILMFFFALFILYVFYVAFEDKKKAKELAESIHKRIDGDVSEGDLTIESDKISNGRAWFLIIVGIIGLFIGGKWVVDGAVAIARAFGLTERLIGLTVIAIGTSLPELVTSIIAAKNKAVDIAVGNAIGSNIFNLLWILGVSSLVKPLPFKVVNNADIIVLMIASCLLILSLATGKKRAIDRNDGILFVSLYIAYLVFCIYRG